MTLVRTQIVTTFEAQRKAVTLSRYRSYSERINDLNALRDALITYENDIIKALAKDYQKPKSEVMLTEIFPVRQEIQHAKRHLRKWMKPKRARMSISTLGTSGQVRPEPKGVCLIIAPWNYPLSLCFGPLVSALAAGNRAILKPSEMTPHTSELIKKIIEDIFPTDLVATFEGDVEVSTELLSLPFDHIFFTGSPKVGKIVMEAAAKSLTSVTLELGGKSPTIIGPDANIKKATKYVAWGKFSNCGQTCIAPDHVYVHHTIADEFNTAIQAELAHMYGPNLEQPKDYSRIVNTSNFKRLSNLLTDATNKGAKTVSGNHTDEADDLITPTLLTNVTDQMDINQEELFGPILPIMKFDDISNVIDQINAKPKPLSLYIFAKDRALVDEIVTNTSSGSVGINITLLQFLHPNLPFGGVNNSGIGAAHGEYGFKAFSHEKSILKDHFSITPMLFPPYTGFVKRLIKILVKVLG